VLPDLLAVFNTITKASSVIPITSTNSAGENGMDCLRCMENFVSTTTEAPERQRVNN
jgi:hypothetical protein